MIGVETLSLLHFITGTREEMEGNIMGEAEEERNEAEEEKLVSEEVMEEMEQEGRKRKKKVQQSLSSPTTPSPLSYFPLPSPPFLPPLLPSSPFTFLPFLGLYLLHGEYFCLTQIQKNKINRNCKLTNIYIYICMYMNILIVVIVCNIFYICSCYQYYFQ